MGLRIALSAGEASGDLLGARLIEALRERSGSIRFEGVAGPRMQALGCRSHFPMERLSVMGLAEVAGRYPGIMLERHRLARSLLRDPPDVFVGIDAPDFNLGLERRLRESGIPTVHYVSPSVWAWRAYRVKKIRRAVDRLLVLFPFERAFYARHGLAATYVGHPLADEIDPVADPVPARVRLGLPPHEPVIALLPGSRMSEAERLSPVLVQTAHWIHRRRPRIRFVVAIASAAIGERFRSALDDAAHALPVHLVEGRSQEAMASSDLVILASGTASLEALLLRRPMVITYRTHPITWTIGRRLLNVRHVGLPNLLADDAIAPELLQEQATAPRLGAAALAMLDSPALLARQRAQFATIHAALKCGASRRAAQAVLALAASRNRA